MGFVLCAARAIGRIASIVPEDANKADEIGGREELPHQCHVVEPQVIDVDVEAVKLKLGARR